jgi:hypothetical protein
VTRRMASRSVRGTPRSRSSTSTLLGGGMGETKGGVEPKGMCEDSDSRTTACQRSSQDKPTGSAGVSLPPRTAL